MEIERVCRGERQIWEGDKRRSRVTETEETHRVANCTVERAVERGYSDAANLIILLSLLFLAPSSSSNQRNIWL